MKLKLVEIIICEACLEGIGNECHTPGCAFYLHNSLGFPVMKELYKVKKEWEEGSRIMCQGPEITIKEEEYMLEKKDELFAELEQYEPNLKVLQDSELSELIYWMNENNMWEEGNLSYESVIDAYKIVMFIKNCNLPHEYHV